MLVQKVKHFLLLIVRVVVLTVILFMYLWAAGYLQHRYTQMKRKLSNNEFEKRMEEIDQIFSEQNLPIHYRPLKAINIYSKKYKTSIIFGGEQYFHTNDNYDSVNLSHSIDEWFERRYGNKLKTDFTKGKVALLINGGVYKLTIPYIFGNALIGFDTNEELSKLDSNDGMMILSLVNFIDDLTDSLTSTISIPEKQEIQNIFKYSNELFDLLDSDKFKDDLCQAAKFDFNIAVESLLHKDISIGNSKWASLQATEKILKYVINYHHKKFPKIHKLKELSEILKNSGIINISNNIIDTIQCDASVRYEKSKYSLSDAINAHHYSIYLSKELLKVCV